MNELPRSPKERLQIMLIDLIDYTSEELHDEYGINEIWAELDQKGQEKIWSFLSSRQQTLVREALAKNPDIEDPEF